MGLGKETEGRVWSQATLPWNLSCLSFPLNWELAFLVVYFYPGPQNANPEVCRQRPLPVFSLTASALGCFTGSYRPKLGLSSKQASREDAE